MNEKKDIIVYISEPLLAAQVRAVLTHFFPEALTCIADDAGFAACLTGMPPSATPLIITGPVLSHECLRALKSATEHGRLSHLYLLDGARAAWADDFDMPLKDRLDLPFRAGSLLDRIARYRSEGGYNKQDKTVALGPFDLKPDGVLVRKRVGSAVKLTEKEQAVLMLLYHNAGAVVARKTLLDGVWGYGENIETHTLETHIYRLRQKIEKDPGRPVYLLTDENGYRLEIKAK